MPSAPRRLFSTDYNFFHPAYWFGTMDARPVSLFRIAFGALMLKEALYHIPLALTFYSDSGITSRAVIEQASWGGGFSLMNGLADAWMAMIFFALWALVALGLLVGWQTRLMTILNFIFLVSVNNRTSILVSGAELAMNAFALWSLFIPLGRCYSLDARRNPYMPRTVFAFPVRALQIQVALIYIFTTVIKLQGKSWPDGSALYMALQATLYTFPTGDWLLANAPSGLLQVLTVFTLVVEGGFALLVFAPLLQPYLRAAGLLLGTLLHVGISVMMAIPNFPLVMLSSYLVFLDSRWVTWLETVIGKSVERARRTVPLRIGEGVEGGQRTAPLQNRPIEAETRKGCGALITDMMRSAALGSYRGVLVLWLVFCLACVMWGNILSNDTLAAELNVNPMPAGLEMLVKSLNMWQSWALFAPEPLQVDGWFILVGQAHDRRLVDVRTDAPPGEIRPRWWIGPWARWEKFEENMMRTTSNNPIFAAWGQYTCREFSDITSLQIVLRARQTSPPGQGFQPYHDQVMWQGDC